MHYYQQIMNLFTNQQIGKYVELNVTLLISEI